MVVGNKYRLFNMNPLKSGIEIFQKYIKNKFIRFIFVGGLNTAFGLGLYCVLIWFGLSYIWATLISHIVGILFNFVTTGTLVFENSDKRLIFKFFLNYGLTYFVNIGVNKILQILFGMNQYFSGIGATIITALISFFILKRFVYKDKSNRK